MNLTNNPGNYTQFHIFEIFQLSGSKDSPIPDQTKICIDKLTFTLHLLVGLMHNSTTAKEPKKWPSYCLKKRVPKLVLLLLE